MDFLISGINFPVVMILVEFSKLSSTYMMVFISHADMLSKSTSNANVPSTVHPSNWIYRLCCQQNLRKFWRHSSLNVGGFICISTSKFRTFCHVWYICYACCIWKKVCVLPTPRMGQYLVYMTFLLMFQLHGIPGTGFTQSTLTVVY